MRSQNGAVTVWTVAAILFLIGMAAVSVDAGLIIVHKRALQSAADLSALAGAQKLPEDPATATGEAASFVSSNGSGGPEIVSITVQRQNTEITVQLQRTVPLYLGRVFGLSSIQISARATAQTGLAGGVVPWGHELGALRYGDEYVLKWGAGHSPGPLTGNFHALNYPGQMNIPQYEEWVKNGYPGDVYIGQMYETHTGNLGVATKRAVEDRMRRAKGMNCSPNDLANLDPECPMIVNVPLVVTFVELNGFGHVRVERVVRFLITRVTNTPSANVSIYGIYLDPEQYRAGRLPKHTYLVE